MNNKRFLTTSNIVKIAMLSTIAYILMLFEFSIPPFPSFYKLDFSDIPSLVGGFAISPLASILIMLVKILIKIITRGTTTYYIGEFANFTIGCAFTFVASYIYHKNKTRKSAMISLLVGSVSMCIVGFILNYFMLIPFYEKAFNINVETLVSMVSLIIPSIKDKFTFVLFCTTPFNIIKSISITLLTLILYKRISPILKK